MKKNKKGFTLVELLAVLVLIAILSGLAVTNVVSTLDNNKKNEFLMDAKRMTSKAEYLLSQSRTYREAAKTENGKIFTWADLNEKGEFETDADGGKYDPNTFVKVKYSNTSKQYQYYICVIGSKRKIGNTCDAENGTGAISSTILTNIDVVKEADSNVITEDPFDDDVQLVFKVGDYFSLTPTATSYTIKAATTGYDSDQTINPSELNLWRVIDIHDDGSFDVVSEYVSSTLVYFKGTTGYANFVGGLQTIAASYAKTGYTIGTRMMGYDGQKLTITDTSAFNGTRNTAPSQASATSPTSGTGEEYSGGVLGDTLYLKDYQLVGNVYKTDTTTYGSTGLKAYKVGTTTATSYWLASRRYSFWRSCSGSGSCRGYGDCCGYKVNTSGGLGSNVIRRYLSYQRVWSDSTNSDSLRPILTLKSGITIKNGTGVKNDPYKLEDEEDEEEEEIIVYPPEPEIVTDDPTY